MNFDKDEQIGDTKKHLWCEFSCEWVPVHLDGKTVLGNNRLKRRETHFGKLLYGHLSKGDEFCTY